MVTFELINVEDLKVSIAVSGRNLSQFASEIGISNSYLTQILNGTRTPSPKVAAKIAKGVNSTITDLFEVKVFQEVSN